MRTGLPGRRGDQEAAAAGVLVEVDELDELDPLSAPTFAVPEPLLDPPSLAAPSLAAPFLLAASAPPTVLPEPERLSVR
ncbi:MAG TPA: hypothetical protein VNA11_18615 [Pseudonocardia sp.]|nr:hypothetical protein [Pseudonocardia sp.]